MEFCRNGLRYLLDFKSLPGKMQFQKLLSIDVM